MSKKKIDILLLSEKDVEKVIRGSIHPILNMVEEAFKHRHNNDVMLPDKISQIFSEDQKRINCMPATIFSEQVCGVKWVSVFPPNPCEGYQNVTGVSLISELQHGFPLCIMDSSLLTNIRTAAVGAVAARFLAPKTPKTIGFIGAGDEARMHFVLLKKTKPSIDVCYVSSRTQRTELAFIEELSPYFPDVKFIACKGNSSMATTNSDIVVTAISAQLPLLKAKDLKKGCLYIHVGGWEDEYKVPKACDKIICDEWESVKHRAQTLSRMYKEGLLNDSDIYSDLAPIILGEKVGRESDSETIYFNSVGLSFIDVQMAYDIYKKAKEIGIGQIFTLCDEKRVSYDLFN